MKNKLMFGLIAGGLVCAVFIGIYLIFGLFESEPPKLNITPKPEIIGKETLFKIEASDDKRGLRKVLFSVKQGEQQKILLEEDFTKAIDPQKKIQTLTKEFLLKPLEIGLKQGKATLTIVAYDRSFRNGQEGNKAFIEWEVTIDTTPPFVRAVAPYHYLNAGGTGVVVYETSEDSVESGVRFGEKFFKGFKVKGKENLWICNFPIPQEVKAEQKFLLYSKDRAGNETANQFSYTIRPKKFRADTITVTDDFIRSILPYFESIGIPNTYGQLVDWFKFINKEQREKDEQRYYELAKSTESDRLWEGVFLRMKDAAPMAGFGDRRTYKYGNQIIGDSIHKGVDLASLEHSPVEAANSGKVTFAGDLGIYGKTVVLDHGQGLFSTYSHLSEIKVAVGQRVSKGEIIGMTGRTGLAGGDHLHFGIMVHGEFVNPVEWWDPLWIKEKISRWLELEAKERVGPSSEGRPKSTEAHRKVPKVIKSR